MRHKCSSVSFVCVEVGGTWKVSSLQPVKVLKIDNCSLLVLTYKGEPVTLIPLSPSHTHTHTHTHTHRPTESKYCLHLTPLEPHLPAPAPVETSDPRSSCCPILPLESQTRTCACGGLGSFHQCHVTPHGQGGVYDPYISRSPIFSDLSILHSAAFNHIYLVAFRCSSKLLLKNAPSKFTARLRLSRWRHFGCRNGLVGQEKGRNLW